MAQVLTDPINYKNIADAIREKNGETKGYLPSEMPEAILSIQGSGGGGESEGFIGTCYGFHVNSNERDPSMAVTYVADAVGMTPAYMDYTTGEFNYGSWRDAFFMPRPCMLRYDGTVDYYLDENDYSKKEDGVTSSDISDDTYEGNAMMEWGRNGRKIWYNIVPDDSDATSYTAYIADYKKDNDFVCWSFINNQDTPVNHFYTSIYNGSLGSSGRLRSLSGKSLMNNEIASTEIAAAKLNNVDGNVMWNIEVWADRILIYLLLYLMGKSLDLQSTFGQGNISSTSSRLNSGSMDTRGLFWGSSETTVGIKVFGMENVWGNQWQRCVGLMSSGGKYYTKYTYRTADGTTVNGYPTTSVEGMLEGNTHPTVNGYVKKMAVNGDSILPNETMEESTTYYRDYFHQNTDAIALAIIGGSQFNGDQCGFNICLSYVAGFKSIGIGAALSCKPLADVFDGGNVLYQSELDKDPVIPSVKNKVGKIHITPVQEKHSLVCFVFGGGNLSYVVFRGKDNALQIYGKNLTPESWVKEFNVTYSDGTYTVIHNDYASTRIYCTCDVNVVVE